jgi:hypothetical protein
MYYLKTMDFHFRIKRATLPRNRETMDFHFRIKRATLPRDRVCRMEEDNNNSSVTATTTTTSFRGIYNETLPSSTAARISHHPSPPQSPQVDEPVPAAQWFNQIPPSILEDGRTEDDDDISVSTETSGMAAPMDALSPWAALLEAVYVGTLTGSGFVSERPPNNVIREHESTTSSRQPKRKSETYSSSTKRLRKW